MAIIYESAHQACPANTSGNAIGHTVCDQFLLDKQG